MTIAQELLSDLVDNVLSQNGEEQQEVLHGIFEKKSILEERILRSQDSEKIDVSDNLSDFSDIAGKRESNHQSIQTLVQQIYRIKAQKEQSAAANDSLRELTKPKLNVSKHELSRGSRKRESKKMRKREAKNKKQKKSKFAGKRKNGKQRNLKKNSKDEEKEIKSKSHFLNEKNGDSGKILVNKTALKNVGLGEGNSESGETSVQSSKTVQLHKKSRKKKNKIREARLEKRSGEAETAEDYVPLFVKRHRGEEGGQDSHTQKNLFGGSLRGSSLDSDVQSFSSRDSERDRALLAEVDRELELFESNREQLRGDFQRGFARLLETRSVDSELGKTLKLSKEIRGSGGSHEDLERTRSTHRASEQTLRSLRRVENMYNELMQKANDLPSGNESWRLPSQTTERGSNNTPARSDLSSLRQRQAQGK